jgi:hypothetical protein
MERTRIVATSVAIVGYTTLGSLVIFFVVGGPFGTLNDVGNALLAVLAAALALTWGSPVPRAATSSAVVGAAIAVVGSALVISRTTGFFLAGLVSGVGFALIGAWLLVASRSLPPGGLRRLGTVAGASMLAGLVGVPAMVMRLDDMASAPGWVWLSFVGWIGTFVLLPAWALWLGRAPGRVRAAVAS